MDTNCTTKDYDQIYAPWLSNPGQLLDLSGWRPEMNLLDLCGGTGAVTREAVRRGANPMSIVLLDLNPRARDLGLKAHLQRRAESLGEEMLPFRFDRVVMRQAVAYLDPSILVQTFRGIRNHLNPRGQFAFNTFSQPRWFARRKGQHFEAGAYWGRTVWHLQTARRGWDLSKFHWFTEDDLTAAIWSAGFHFMESKHEGGSLRFICHR